jgi:hypothetical protein
MNRAMLLAACLFVAVAAVGCATRTEVFLQNAHRVKFALGHDELETVQFFINKQLVAHEAGAADGSGAVIIVDEGTPGAATEVGDSWLRVSFSPGGRGVPFVAVETRAGESAYWLATEVEGESGFRPVKNVPGRELRIDGRVFHMRSGASARLLISSKDLDKLIKQRTHLKGRKPGS